MWYCRHKIAIRFVSRSNYSSFKNKREIYSSFGWLRFKLLLLTKSCTLIPNKQLDFQLCSESLEFCLINRKILTETKRNTSSVFKSSFLNYWATTKKICLFKVDFLHPQVFKKKKQDYAIQHEQASAYFSNGLFLSNAKAIICFPSLFIKLPLHKITCTDELLANEVVSLSKWQRIKDYWRFLCRKVLNFDAYVSGNQFSATQSRFESQSQARKERRHYHEILTARA